ncbi:MAG: exo 1,3/1,4-beta-D-glucan glucohydrolase [Myxococcales bacterium]|nr:exo 1,3/1,4-beta-D-glucan glucohydrolase [Myxococcales bacterium]
MSAPIEQGVSGEPAEDDRIHPKSWPAGRGTRIRNDEVEGQVSALIAKMSLEELVGQVIQANIEAVTPDEAREYHLGSILNGGNTAPGGNIRSGPEPWLALADAYWDANMKPGKDHVGIPLIWGTDAVHGHSNILGATLFPHNIGLGAANDPELMEQIGRVTAKEIRATGIEWTFAPTMAVARDDRWGRTYESWSEDPKLVATYAGAFVRGLQGRLESKTFLGAEHTLATAKHFVGDGGTERGIDQGNNIASERELQTIHAAGYYPAIDNGVQVIMASFNSYHGLKLHGYRALLTDVLVERMGFDGFIVGDWNGHAQVKGCSRGSCAIAFNAGLDMFMVPDDWKELHGTLLRQVKNGTIARARLEEAVSRILRVKYRLGMFSAKRPSLRPGAGDWSILADPAHKALARRAVRSSLVLLKNNKKVLPINPSNTVLVAGNFADDIGKLCGGWTLSWQGTGNTNEHFPHGQSVYAGIKDAVEGAGGKVLLSTEGEYEERPDVAVVVFGEEPYAEYQGDREHVDYEPGGPGRLLRKLQAEGIRTVAVFVSGRPMWVNPEINASDAFVAAWLPGDQGAGIADVLIANADGSKRNDFKGKLSFSWPSEASGEPVNIGDSDYAPQFALGYGLTYTSTLTVNSLPEIGGAKIAENVSNRTFMNARAGVSDWTVVLVDQRGKVPMTSSSHVASPAGTVSGRATDDQIQEDVRTFVWKGRGSLGIEGKSIDLRKAFAKHARISFRYRVRGTDVGYSELQMRCSGVPCGGSLDVTPVWKRAKNQGWREMAVPLRCLIEERYSAGMVTQPLRVIAEGPLELDLAWVRLVPGSPSPEGQDQSACVLR